MSPPPPHPFPLIKHFIWLIACNFLYFFLHFFILVLLHHLLFEDCAEQSNLSNIYSAMIWIFFSLLQSVPINFKFKFYGHDVSKITIATGGNISKGVNIYCIFRGWKMDWRKIYIDIIGDYQYDERYWYLDSLKCAYSYIIWSMILQVMDVNYRHLQTFH